MTNIIKDKNRNEVENIVEKTNDFPALVAQKKAKSKKMEGASLVEYALLIALIAVICIITIRLVGRRVSTNFSQLNSNLVVTP